MTTTLSGHPEASFAEGSVRRTEECIAQILHYTMAVPCCTLNDPSCVSWTHFGLPNVNYSCYTRHWILPTGDQETITYWAMPGGGMTKIITTIPLFIST